MRVRIKRQKIIRVPISFFIRLSIVKIAPYEKLKFTFALLRPHLIGHN